MTCKYTISSSFGKTYDTKNHTTNPYHIQVVLHNDESFLSWV